MGSPRRDWTVLMIMGCPNRCTGLTQNRDDSLSRLESPRTGDPGQSSWARLSFAVLIGAASLIFWQKAFANDWPHLLGPTANALSTETGLLDSWPKEGPPIAWQIKIGSGYSAPSVLGTNLVVHHRLGDQEIIECLDPATGQSRWRHAYASEFIDPYGYNNGPRSSPYLTPDHCYTFGAEGKLCCLDLQTGRVLWQRDTARDWEIPPAFFGVGTSPTLEQGRLIAMVGGQPNAGVVALDPGTGKALWENVGEKSWQGLRMIGWPSEPPVRWQRSEKQASYSTPVAATIHGKRHLLCLTRQGLVSLDPDSGLVHFSFWFRSRLNDSVNAMSPLVQDDLILISAAYYKVGSVLLRVRPDGAGVDEVWRSTALEQHWANPVLDKGYLYGFSGRNEPDARFRCVEFTTGKIMWEQDERWVPHSTLTPNVYGRGSCLLADGKLIALGEGGLLGLFRPDPKARNEISRAQIAPLHYPCWAGPVLANKQLFLRSEDCLVCLSLAKP